MQKNSSLTRLLVSVFIIAAVALALSLAVNAGLDGYKNGTSAVLRLEAEYGEREAAVRAEIAEILASQGESDAAAEKYYADRALVEALRKQESYYLHYTKNDHQNTKEQRDYHYYGQFYEMFNNVYNANVIFLGSSRSVYAINPLYLEKNEALDEYSFYNFSLNAAGPSYYQKWYGVFKNEAKYPTPDTVIYCVDWFMFDSGTWMWRDFSYDTRPGGALYEARQTVKSKIGAELSATSEVSEVTTAAPVTDAAETALTPENEEGKKEYGSFFELLGAWWNGEEKLELDFVADFFTKQVPLFSEQKRIPDMIAYYSEGDAANAKADIAAKTAELETRYTELLRERDELKAGGVSGEYPEVVIPDYYSNRTECIDKDGNLSYRFYKGFIPWEYKYHHQNSDGAVYNDKEVENGIRQVNGTSEAQIKAFRELVRTMQNDGIEVILIQVPDYAKHRPKSEIKKYTAIIEELAAELGVEFYDYNSQTSVVGSWVADYKRYYSNWNHMNEIGAKVFSQKLSDELVEILK